MAHLVRVPVAKQVFLDGPVASDDRAGVDHRLASDRLTGGSVGGSHPSVEGRALKALCPVPLLIMAFAKAQRCVGYRHRARLDRAYAPVEHRIVTVGQEHVTAKPRPDLTHQQGQQPASIGPRLDQRGHRAAPIVGAPSKTPAATRARRWSSTVRCEYTS